jgi:hypothetical protein
VLGLSLFNLELNERTFNLAITPHFNFGKCAHIRCRSVGEPCHSMTQKGISIIFDPNCVTSSIELDIPPLVDSSILSISPTDSSDCGAKPGLRHQLSGYVWVRAMQRFQRLRLQDALSHMPVSQNVVGGSIKPSRIITPSPAALASFSTAQLLEKHVARVMDNVLPSGKASTDLG